MTIIPRLLYGFLSQSSDPYNLSLPWQFSNQDGLFKMNYDIVAAAKDNLKAWAHTNWGERLGRFRYGLDARRYLFEPVPIAKVNILQNARDQLPRFFSYLSIDKLEILSNDDDQTIPENGVIFSLRAHFKENENKTISLDEIINT